MHSVPPGQAQRLVDASLRAIRHTVENLARAQLGQRRHRDLHRRQDLRVGSYGVGAGCSRCPHRALHAQAGSRHHPRGVARRRRRKRDFRRHSREQPRAARGGRQERLLPRALPDVLVSAQIVAHAQRGHGPVAVARPARERAGRLRVVSAQWKLVAPVVDEFLAAVRRQRSDTQR